MKKILRTAAIVTAFAAAFYLYKAGDLYFNQTKYVYHPQKEWTATPESEGLAFEDLMLRSQDGVPLSAWYVPAAADKGTVLFLHGNARNISSDLDAVKMFNLNGYNVLAIDYRGYGKSGGAPSEDGTYLDADAAWDYLVGTRAEKPERIVVCGRSLGSGIAADLASRENPGALILEAAFTSLGDAGQDVYPYFPVKLLSRFSYDNLNKLKDITCPLLIVHSKDDELIPFRHGQKLYEAYQGRKAFVEIGGPHRGGYKPTLGKYHQGVKEFLESL